MWAVWAAWAMWEDFRSVEQVADISSLPVELLHTLSKYIPLSDAKTMALTSKKMHAVFEERIWLRPKFGPTYSSFYMAPEAGYHTWPDIDRCTLSVDNLTKFSHLPIRELNARWLNFRWWKNWDTIVKCFPKLLTFNIDEDDQQVELCHIKEVFEKSSVSVVLRTNSLRQEDCMNVRKLVTVLGCIQVKGVIVNHVGMNEAGYDHWDREYVWTFHQLKELPRSQAVIQSVSARSISITESNVRQVIDFLSSFGCPLTMEIYTSAFENDYDTNKGYTFCLEDMQYLLQRRVTVPLLSTSLLRSPKTHQDVSAHLSVIQKLRGLKELGIDDLRTEWDFPLPDEFADLPVKHISTDQFNLQNYKVVDVVQALRKMKHLECIEIGIHWSNFTFTLEDLKLFQGLPVKSVCIQGFDLSDVSEHVSEYRELMRKISVKKIMVFGREREEIMGDIYALGIRVFTHR